MNTPQHRASIYSPLPRGARHELSSSRRRARPRMLAYRAVHAVERRRESNTGHYRRKFAQRRSLVGGDVSLGGTAREHPRRPT